MCARKIACIGISGMVGSAGAESTRAIAPLVKIMMLMVVVLRLIMRSYSRRVKVASC